MDRTSTAPRTYSAQRTADLMGVSYRQLDYWCRLGVLNAEVDAAGSGSRRCFTLAGVRVGRVLAQLRSLGATTELMASVGVDLEHLPDHEWSGLWVVDATTGSLRTLGEHTGFPGYVVDLTLAADLGV